MTRNFIGTLFIGLFLGYSLLFAQTDQQHKLTTTDGLPSSTIVEMVQDKTGFIWIATNDGLARYDGQKFKIFRNNTKNLNSLIDNKIISLQMTNDKFLLVTQSGNIQLFDPLTEQFATLFTAKFLKDQKATMQKCYLSNDGKHLWGFIQGLRLVHYEFDKKKFTIFNELNLTGRKNSLHDFYFSERGFIYVYCNFGIIQLNTKTYKKKTCFYQFDMGKDAIGDKGDGSFAERTNGEMVAPLKRSLLIYNPIQNSFRSIPFPKGEKIDLYYTIKKLKDENIYIGAANRLFRLNKNDSIEVIDKQSKSLFKAYLLDNSNQLWVNNNEGIEKKSLNPTSFQAFPYQKTFKEDLINQILKIPFRSFESPYAPFFDSKQKRSWFIEMNTISTYDFVKKKLLTTPINCCNLTLKLSEKGKLWTYSNYKGLFEIDTLLQVQKLHPNSLLPQFTSERGLDVSDIQPVKNGVWVASDNSQGLFFYDIKKQKYTHVLQNDPTDSTTLSNNSLQCLQVDPYNENLLWIGTSSGGLCLLNTKTLKIKRILEKDGLPNGTIFSIKIDAKGFLWCSTNKGLVSIHPKTLQMRYFTKADGLQDNEFIRNLSAVLPDKRLVFGGKTGITIFNPLTINEVSGNLPVVLTSLKINNEIAEIGSSKSPLSASIHSINTLELKHNQNFLTFEFAGLEFAKPQQIQYKYRLSGIDEKWVNSDVKGIANYTQLSAGKYTFELLSTNADGVWGKKPKILNVIIHAAWWATWWAFSFYAIVLGGIIYWFVQNRLKQLQHQQEMTLKRQESEQLRAMDELKTRFFSNITHELRTPLTLILSPTETLMRETKHDERTLKSLFSINRNAQKLLRLINQLLDLSKLESNGMQISLSRGNFTDFLVEIVDNFHNQAIERNIELTYSSKIDNQERLFDADKIEKIVYNLLSNALKFSEKGQVKVECYPVKFDNLTENTNSFIEIQISDTGIGIDEDKIPHIFERFFQVEDNRTRRYEGTGIGLSLVKELIELMGGSITVQSKVGKGTMFSLILPLAIAEKSSFALPIISSNKKDILLENQAIMPLNTSALNEGKPLIIIIEDNNDLRDFIAEILSSDYRILTAVNGFEGWEIIQQEIPDLVLSDVMMPFMDGYELCEKIKEDVRTNHIAVILLTARSSHEKRVEGLTLGADDYLTKPFHSDELCLRINNLLAHQQKLRTYYYNQFNLPEIPLESQPITDPFIQRLYDILEQRLDDSLFSVEELSTEIGMSRRTLHRKLTATINLSANELIRTYRLKKAAIFLKSGKNVSETAYLVGFDSPAYFSTSFKEFFQKTPSEYIGNL